MNKAIFPRFIFTSILLVSVAQAQANDYKNVLDSCKCESEVLCCPNQLIIKTIDKALAAKDSNLTFDLSDLLLKKYVYLVGVDSARWFLGYLKNKGWYKVERYKPHYYQVMAHLFFKTGPLDSAVYYFEKRVNHFEAHNDSVLLPKAYMALAAAYSRVSDKIKEYENLNKAIELAKAANDTLTLIESYCNFGSRYLYENDAKRAKNYFLKAYKLTQSFNSHMTVTIYESLGNTYVIEEKTDSASYFLQKALQIVENTGNIRKEESVQSSIGYHELMVGSSKKAIGHLKRAVYLDHKVQNLPMKCMNLSYLALAYSKLEIWKEAIKFGKKSYLLSDSLDFLDGKVKSSEYLSKIYEAMNDSANAYKFLRIYNEQKDSLDKVERIKDLDALEVQYETQQKAQENKILQLENDVIAQQVEDGKRLKNRLFLIVATISILIIVVFLAWFNQRTQAKKLKLQNAEIEHQRGLLEKADGEKALLIKEIHHRVKNNFQVVSSLLELQSRGIEDVKAKELAEEGQNRVKSMSLIHQRLYQNDDLLISFDEYTKALVNEISAMYDKEVETDIKTNNFSFDIDTAIPLGLILNELITNSFKYGLDQANNKISIHFEKLESEYKMVVKDNGKGIDHNFDLTRTKSLGLKLVHRLSQQLKGKAEILKEEGAAFAIYFKDTEMRKLMN